MSVSQYLLDFLTDWQKDYDLRHAAVVESFDVDELALSVGRFYEKIRKVIDWKDENALKRGAIARAINRDLIPQIGHLSLEGVDQKTMDLAETMIFELMRSGYFDNKLINAETVATTAKILHKYLLAFGYLNSGQDELTKRDLQLRIKLQNWTIQIMACELEELLAPAYKTWAVVALMDKVLADRIKIIPANTMDAEDARRWRQIAVWRSLYDADDYLLAYELLKMYNPDFTNYERDFSMVDVQRLYDDKRRVDADLVVSFGRQFLRIANKYDAVYRMIGLITESAKLESVEQGEAFFADEAQVEARYHEIYQEKYKSLKSRLLKTAFWTTLSIIIANFASVLILEIPVARLAKLDFGLWPILFDILIPTVAMFLLVIIIRPPKAENEEIAWREITKIIYQSGEQDVYEIRQRQRQSKFLQWFFYGTSLVAGLVGLWALYKIFTLAGLPWTSVYLNVIYITMSFFASLTIRHQAGELTVYERSSFFDFILDIFAVPLARIGQYFSKKWKEYNVFAIFFSLLIDSPLSAFIGFIDDWRAYLKENKSEIR